MTASEIQMGVARADEAREQKQREFLRPLVDAHLAVLDARAPRLIANSAEADRVNLLWEKGLLWEDGSGKLSADPPTSKPNRLRELLQRKASGVGVPGVLVTKEMLDAAHGVWHETFSVEREDADWFELLYRAMVAVAPVELVSAAEDRIAALEADREKARLENVAIGECWVRAMQTVAELESQVRMLMSDKANHDYIGPAKDGKAVADEVHERFHKALGDVATGGVMRPARDQMEKALADAKAKDGKAPQPIRGITRSGDPRIGGWMA